jgi:hypothetical protein
MDQANSKTEIKGIEAPNIRKKLRCIEHALMLGVVWVQISMKLYLLEVLCKQLCLVKNVLKRWQHKIRVPHQGKLRSSTGANTQKAAFRQAKYQGQ